MNSFKKIFILISMTLAVSAQAKTADGRIEALVKNDLDSVLSETYDEGEGSAEVAAADCKIVKKGAQGLTVFCSVTVDVQPSMESDYKSQAVCTSMGYRVSPDLQSIENFSGWPECIEYVNDVTEF